MAERDKLSERRDGSSLTDLTNYLFNMRDHVRGLAKSLRLADQAAGRQSGPKRTTTLHRALVGLSMAVRDLVDELPGEDMADKLSDPRFLCLGLLAPWIDERGDIAARSMEGLHGHSQTMSLPSIIEFLSLQKKSGLLKIEAPNETVTLEFTEGEVIHAESDNAPACDRIGAILVDNGEIDEGDLEALLAKHPGRRRSLGMLLEVQEVVSREALVAALETQVQRIFDRLFGNPDAFFEFTETTTDHRETKVRLNVVGLLLGSACKADRAE